MEILEQGLFCILEFNLGLYILQGLCCVLDILLGYLSRALVQNHSGIGCGIGIDDGDLGESLGLDVLSILGCHSDGSLYFLSCLFLVSDFG